MSAARFFVDADLFAGTRLLLPAEVAHHAQHALRLKDGAAITLFNGRGGEYAARLVAGQRAAADIERFDPIERESPLALTLIQAQIAHDKLDWVIEKGVELGVARIVIAAAERSVVRLAGERLDKRRTRWREIARAACCQCGRNRVPSIDAAASIEDACAQVAGVPQRFVLAPGAATSLTQAASTAAAVIAVGPEGGFSEEELVTAERNGFVRCALGPRVLRTETAGLVALAALQARAGDLT